LLFISNEYHSFIAKTVDFPPGNQVSVSFEAYMNHLCLMEGHSARSDSVLSRKIPLSQTDRQVLGAVKRKSVWH